MSNHPNWHDQQAQYSGASQQRHHPTMDPYQGPSPSSGNYPQAHLPPPVGRQPSQQQWMSTGGASQDFAANSRSSGPYSSGFDASPSSLANSNSPMRQHGGHHSPYASQSSYAPPQSHGPPDPQMHPGSRGSMPPQHDYPGGHGPGGGYSHHHHPQSQYQQAPQQGPPPPQHHHGGHPSQQQHWNHNGAHLPSVLQPQSLQPPPGPGGNRTPGVGGPSGNPMDRAYGGIAGKQQDDDMDDDDAGNYDDYDGKGKGRGGDGGPATNKGTSDFVKKLFSMLDDKAYESVVAWSPSGDSFVVKDMNDFTKHVLPRNFRHSNFASFVRQLNKYDFHKVKNPEDGSGTVGEHVWEFQHPDFVRGREDLLENVKRKIPAKKKPNTKGGVLDGDRDDSPSMPAPMMDAHAKMGESDADLRMQVAHLTALQDQMQNHVLALTKQYQGVIGEMLTFQRNMVQQDQLMQNLIQYLMNLEQDRRVDLGPDQPSASSFMPQTGAGGGSDGGGGGSFLPPPPGAYENAAGGAPFMNNLQHRAGDASTSNSSLKAAAVPPGSQSTGPVGSAETGSNTTNTGSSTRMSNMTTAPSTVAPLSPKSVASPMDGAKTPEMSQGLSSMGMHPPMDEMGRRGSTLRMLNGEGSRNGSGAGASSMPKLDSRTTSYDSRDEGESASQSASAEPSNGPPMANKNRNKLLRPRRPTLVPGWTAPPRVLLVDDDEVCRRLSSKFLQVFGCSIDYAVDGMSAVSKMNAQRYDLVLMDIVMPNLDGMSATSLIRQFDQSTPIISMTSNSGPSELMNYMSSGMTDMLPKPFTKEGLLEMLEKHLMHLKDAQRGYRAASTDSGAAGEAGGIKRESQPTPAAQGTNATPSGGAAEGDGVNPLAGMGFTDEEYVAMLQNLIAAGTGDDELAKALFGNDTFTPINDLTPGARSGAGPSPAEAQGTGYKRNGEDEARGGEGKRGRFGDV